MLIVVLPTFLPLSYEMTAKRGGLAFNVAIFILVYIMMRLYFLEPKLFEFIDNKRNAFFLMIINWLLILLISHFFEKIVPVVFQEYFTSDWYWNNYNTIFSFGCILGGFFLIKNINMPYHPLINKVGGITASIYIVHQNPSFISPLWKMTFWLQSKAGINNLLFYLASVICVVFLLSGIIDWITNIFVSRCLKTKFVKQIKRISENIYN